MPSTRMLVDVGSDGMCEYAHFNDDGELESLEWTSDVTDIIEDNKRLQNDGTNGYGESREWKRTASIPSALVRVWEMEMGVAPNFLLTLEGMPILMAKIKDPDYRHLRTDK